MNDLELLVGTRGGLRARGTEVHRLVSQIRDAHHLPLLKPGPNLARAATARARHLAGVQVLSHDGWTQALREAGVSGRAIGENIAMGYRDPDDVVRAWMNSPGHRRNLLDPDFRWHATAAAIDDDGDTWWSQMLAGEK